MKLVVLSWLDRNRGLFVMLMCGIREGEEINHKWLRQLDKSGRALLDMVIINVPQPKAIATYYKGAGTIDRHNRIRADELWMDRNPATKYWDKTIKLGVLGIVCINAYQFFQQVVHANNRTMSCLEFFRRLADKLIKNQEGVHATKAANVDQAAAAVATINAPTIQRTLCLNKIAGGKCHAQGWCLCGRCKKQTTYVCRRCMHKTDRLQKQFWFCNPTMVEGSKCFAKHIEEKHR